MKWVVPLLIMLVSCEALAVTISGKVTDEQGKPIEGATVSIEGVRQSVLTNDAGIYRFADINAPTVHLHVSSERYVHGDRELGKVTEDRRVNFVLTPASIENITVTATAMRSSVLESVTPVSVLNERSLQKHLAPTLGETLKQTPGVHSSYFGPVSSSPVIRGADGPRVKIVQNGLDISDASRIGPDHNVSASAANAQQVEVLRGPATLQYGSGAIGGVVNIVDNRIPFTVPYQLEAQAEINYSSVDNGKYADIAIDHGAGEFAWHLSGYTQLREDTSIPGYASKEPDGDEPRGVLENSAMDTDSVVAGFAHIGRSSRIGMSVEKMKNQYGVPGHAHHEDEHEEEHSEEEAEESHEEGVFLDADMERYQLTAQWDALNEWLTNVTLAAAYTDYNHAEIEGDEIATQFSNQSTDLKFSMSHAETAGWHGVIGLQWHDGDYRAIGEEAFTPPTGTRSYAVYLIEQKKIGEVTVELGGRIENNQYDPLAASLEIGLPEEAHDADNEQHELHYEFVDNANDFTSTSFSVGGNWEYTKGQSIALTLSRSARAPSHQELYSGGQHLASQTYEIGLAFQPEDLTEQWQQPVNEVSHNLDLTLRRFTGSWGYTASIFYNRVDDYIFQKNTGEHFGEETHQADQAEAHEEEGPEEHEEHSEDGLPIYIFQQADATIYGVEVETHWDLSENLRLLVFGDAITAKLDDQSLPRIPPLRVGSELSYQSNDWLAEVSYTWHDRQDDTAPFESATESYSLLGLYAEYSMFKANTEWVFFTRLDNLLDEEARVHTSFLNDRAPLPGRNIKVGVRARF